MCTNTRERNSMLGCCITPCQTTLRYGTCNSRHIAHHGPGTIQLGPHADLWIQVTSSPSLLRFSPSCKKISHDIKGVKGGIKGVRFLLFLKILNLIFFDFLFFFNKTVKCFSCFSEAARATLYLLSS